METHTYLIPRGEKRGWEDAVGKLLHYAYISPCNVQFRFAILITWIFHWHEYFAISTGTVELLTPMETDTYQLPREDGDAVGKLL